MRILVVGSEGYLGTALCPALERAGHEVRRVDALVWGQRPHPACRIVDRSSILGMDVYWTEVVIYLAALAHDTSNRIPRGMVMKENALKPAELARHCLDNRIRFIAVSSLSVFDKGASAYPSSKRLLESRLAKLGAWRGIDVVRFGTLFGTTRDTTVDSFRPHLLLNSMMLDSIAHGRIRVNGPLLQRPVLHLEQAVGTLASMVEDRPGCTVQNRFLCSGCLSSYARAVTAVAPAEIQYELAASDSRDYGWYPSLDEDCGTLPVLQFQLKSLRNFVCAHEEDLLHIRDTAFSRLYDNLGLK